MPKSDSVHGVECVRCLRNMLASAFERGNIIMRDLNLDFVCNECALPIVVDRNQDGTSNADTDTISIGANDANDAISNIENVRPPDDAADEDDVNGHYSGASIASDNSQLDVLHEIADESRDSFTMSDCEGAKVETESIEPKPKRRKYCTLKDGVMDYSNIFDRNSLIRQLSNEHVRLATFKHGTFEYAKYPFLASMLAVEFACDGFYNDYKEDDVVCLYCSLRFPHSDSVSFNIYPEIGQVNEFHRKYRGSCPFVCGKPVGNVAFSTILNTIRDRIPTVSFFCTSPNCNSYRCS